MARERSVERSVERGVEQSVEQRGRGGARGRARNRDGASAHGRSAVRAFAKEGCEAYRVEVTGKNDEASQEGEVAEGQGRDQGFSV